MGLITDVLTRESLSLHRTWLLADGSNKADTQTNKTPRLLLGGHRKQGGCIRLWPDEAITTSLGVAEGIESALTLGRVHKPVISMVDAGNLAQLPVMPGVDELLIAVDRDKAGIAAAMECASRWHAAGVRVEIAKPPKNKTDLNDVAKEAAR